MAIVYLGIDLAKCVFPLYGVDGAGKPAPVHPSVAGFQTARRADAALSISAPGF